jgi:site-specific DNA-methyltransferase (adenine-specific)
MTKPYYQDKWVTIYHGDCREILPQLDVKVDLVLTDPPYGMRGGKVPIKGYGIAKSYKKSESIGEPWGFSLDWIKDIERLQPQHLTVHCNSYMIGQICYLVEQFMKPICLFTWYKRNAPPNIRNTPKFDCEFITWHKVGTATNKNASLFRSQLFDIPFLVGGCMATERIVNNNGEPIHPTQKPTELESRLILGMSDEAELILDPFLGSGTTCYCAKKLNRYSIGIEIEEKYCEIAARRCSQSVMELNI